MQRNASLSLIILLCLTAVVQAEPTVVVGDHLLLPNTAGQAVPIYVTGIEPNTVNGIIFSVMIDGGGPAYGGALGPVITAMDFDSGPTIWTPPSAPSGHNPPNMFIDGQLATADFLLTTGFVTADSGLVVTLTVDTTGFSCTHSLELVGFALESPVSNTEFTGNVTAQSITNGTVGDLCPEPSSMVLGLFAIAGFGVVAIRKRRIR